MKPGERIDELRNLGPTSSRWLQACNITTRDQLAQLGAVTAFCIVRTRFPKASLNLLWALAAALEDIDWRELSPERKLQLCSQLAELTHSD